MNIRPLADRVIIMVSESQDDTRNGIVIPDSAKSRPQEGEVIEVGAGRKTEDGNLVEMEVKKGDRVLYGMYAGTEFHVGGRELLVMRESDILVVID